MIRLHIKRPDALDEVVVWDRPSMLIGRGRGCDLIIPTENVSSRHGRIEFTEDAYLFSDLGSTNGSVLIRGNRKHVLNDEQRSIALAVGDIVCLATPDIRLHVEAIEVGGPDPAEDFENTILAEANTRPAELEDSLGKDFEGLVGTVRLSRDLVGLETIEEIARATCQTCLQVFPNAKHAVYLHPESARYIPLHLETRDEEVKPGNETLARSQKLLHRCLQDRKGFLFLFEQNQMQAIATRIMHVEELETGEQAEDQIMLLCPLLHNDRCFGFIEVRAPITPSNRNPLTRRDLALATLMGNLIAGRVHDLETQQARLKLARKATAGFLSATVGHCFKNLLFVPMSMSKMLPMCVEQGKMDEVHWMLARNGVNIRYLDILSNEFAAASKDPTQGFGETDIQRLLCEGAELVNQIAPDKVTAECQVPDDLPNITAHGAALKRLLMNLTLNAVDAFFGQTTRTTPGKIEMSAMMDLRNDELIMTVSDDGPGIPGPILDNLRDIYKRVRASTDALSELEHIAEQVNSTKQQGFKEHYGLGFLFVCQTVHMHHGRMEIQSREGEGTQFTIHLPHSATDASAHTSRTTVSDA